MKARTARPKKAAPKRPSVMTGAAIPILAWPPDEDRVEAIFTRLSGVMPDPKTELNFSNAFTLVVAVALSAQATDVSVNKATERLFAVADTPAKMLALGEEGLIPFIASIGLYRGKARNVIALSRTLIEQHGGMAWDEAGFEAVTGLKRGVTLVTLAPERIAIGGGVVATRDYLFPRLRAALAEDYALWESAARPDP